LGIDPLAFDVRVYNAMLDELFTKVYNAIVQPKRTDKLIMSTKTVSVSDLRSNLADALEAINKDDILIVTRRGKKERAIIDLDRLEDLLAISDPEYLQKIQEARKSKEYFSHEEVFGNL